MRDDDLIDKVARKFMFGIAREVARFRIKFIHEVFKSRSTHPEVFCKKGVLKSFAIFAGLRPATA